MITVSGVNSAARMPRRTRRSMTGHDGAAQVQDAEHGLRGLGNSRHG